MRVRLLHPDPEVTAGLDTGPTRDAADLVRDLGVTDVADLMAGGDPFVRDVALATLQRPLADLEAIAWRQAVTRDALNHPAVLRELYDLADRAVAARTGVRTWRLSDSPASVVDHNVGVLLALLDPLRALRRVADAAGAAVLSPGLTALLADAAEALPPDWFARAEDQLQRLRLPGGPVLSARDGAEPLVTDLALLAPAAQRRTWRAFAPRRTDEFTWTVPDEDSAGVRALADLRDRGLAPVAQVLTRASEQILGFFTQLRFAAAFYLGCVTLRDRLRAAGLPTVLPEARPASERELTATGLVDAGLVARARGAAVVGNDLAADGTSLVVVTGANQGGKSTLLRAVGLAQLLMQSGAVVGAAGYRASVSPRVHTHFRREEDAALRSGKLDEELTRMSAIVDRAGPGDLVLLNESFASTNEVEGARILHGVVDGLTDAGLRVWCVTHLHEFSGREAARRRPGTLFLRAERRDDGSRTFRVVPGEPRPTSHGDDIWSAVMGGA